MIDWLDRRFGLSERGTTVATELRAGLVTFLTLAYILAVNPQILGGAGLPAGDVVFATAVASAVACLLMGWLANYPFALAPGMGLNTYFAVGVVGGLGLAWPTALAAVFVAGVVFLLLSFGGLRRVVLEAIPMPLEMAATTGIGLFLAFIGLRGMGVGATTDGSVAGSILSGVGLLVMVVLLVRRVAGGLLVAIAGVTVVAWGLGIAPPPESFLQWPTLPTETLFALDFAGLASTTAITAVIAFLFVDLFDTTGTLMGVGRLGGFLDEDGSLPRADRAFFADAAGTTVGALVGTSPVTSYIESATGIEEGGRTGLTAITVGGLFLTALFVTPVLVAVPAIATAPALVVVGALMMTGGRAIEWGRLDVGLPALLTTAVMPMTSSIANGLAAGIVSWVAIRLLGGRFREIHPLLAAVAVGLVALYAVIL